MWQWALNSYDIFIMLQFTTFEVVQSRACRDQITSSFEWRFDVQDFKQDTKLVCI